jgi:hypothetical protein
MANQKNEKVFADMVYENTRRADLSTTSIWYKLGGVKCEGKVTSEQALKMVSGQTYKVSGDLSSDGASVENLQIEVNGASFSLLRNREATGKLADLWGKSELRGGAKNAVSASSAMFTAKK